jgi:hypothetical protein
MHYAYFGGVDRWGKNQGEGGTATATAAQLNELVGVQFRPGDADRVLMADLIAYFGNGTKYSYNHGFQQSGAFSIYTPDQGFQASGANYNGPASNISGINELFGDGHVAWFSNSDLRTSFMVAGNPYVLPNVYVSGIGVFYYTPFASEDGFQ